MSGVMTQAIPEEHRIRVERINFDVRNLTDDELVEALLWMREQISEMDVQMESANAECAGSGERADPEWWNKVNVARRIIGRQQSRVQFEMHKRKGVRRKGPNFENVFVKAAKDILPEAVYGAIVQAARDRMRVFQDEA